MELPTSVNHLYGRNKFGSTYLKTEGKEYKKRMIKYIKEEVKKQSWIKLDKGQYCYIDEIVYFNCAGRDADNLKKLQQDSISGSNVVWFDDTFALPRTNRVYIDSENPRIEMVITPVEFIGIFDNKEDMDLFISKCKTCNRYKRNCSILKNALEGRIQDDVVKVDNWNCNKFKEIKIKNIKKKKEK